MTEFTSDSAAVSFMEGALILIGILWVSGYLRRIVYVPVVIKEKKKEEEKEVVVQNNEHIIFRETKKSSEEYTDFEELKS